MQFKKYGIPLLWITTWILFALVLTTDHDGYPDRLATHFNASGKADGWMDKESFRTSWIITTLGLNGLILGVFWVIRFLPDPMINLPHRDHWLSADRQAETFASLLRVGFLISIPLTLLFTSLYHQVMHANLKIPPQLGSRIWIEAALSIIVIALPLGYHIFQWYHPDRTSGDAR